MILGRRLRLSHPTYPGWQSMHFEDHLMKRARQDLRHRRGRGWLDWDRKEEREYQPTTCCRPELAIWAGDLVALKTKGVCVSSY